MNKKYVLSCALLICILALSGIVYLSFSWSGNLEDQPRGFEAEKLYSYFVTTNGTYTVAYNSSGFAEFGGTNDADIINWALGNLTSGRTYPETVYLKGNFTIDDTIIIAGYTTFLLDGWIFLADTQNIDMLRNEDYGASGNDDFITIQGIGVSGFNGNAGAQTSGNIISLWDVYDSNLLNFHVTNIQEKGIYMYACGRDHISGVWSGVLPHDEEADYGFYASGLSDSTISDCIWQQQVYFSGGSSNHVTNIYMGGTGAGPQLYWRCANSELTNIRCDSSSGDGIEIGDIAHGSCFTNVHVTRPQTSGDTAIYVNNADHIRIVNAVLGQKDEGSNTPHYWTYGIEEANGADYNIYLGIDFKNCSTAYTGLGSHSHVSDSLDGDTWIS